MASSSARAAANAQGPNIAAMKEQVYEGLAPLTEENKDYVFTQGDIFDLDIIPNDDMTILLQVCQLLVDEKLFKVLGSVDNTLAWKLRTREEARRYRSLTIEQDMVYAYIDEAGEDGAWTRTIKGKTGLHDSVFRAAIKHLESKNMITEMKSVEHPARKMYILSSLRPSERATGGPWYTDGELDEEFINTAMQILYDYIMKRTFYFSKTQANAKQPKKIVKKMTPEEVKAARDKGLGPRIKEEPEDERTSRRRIYEAHLPMPAGYQGYPTLNELTLFVENAQVFSQTLSAIDIQQLLDTMCYDDRISRVIVGSEGVAYKALRKSLRDEDERRSVLTEAPCGRCPVFDLCEDGGPVGPSNCEYFNDWLNM